MDKKTKRRKERRTENEGKNNAMERKRRDKIKNKGLKK
jgi:hypothetical protein